MTFASLTTGKTRRDSSTSSAKKWRPHDYQKRAIKHLVGQGAAGLFMRPGLGKTTCALALIKLLLNAGQLRRVLIIAPLRVVYEVWPKEIEKWSDFSGLTWTILHGKDKRELLRSDTVIHLVNPEGLPMLVKREIKVVRTRFGAEKQKTVYSVSDDLDQYDLLIVDESTLFKHSNTDRFKRLKQMLDRFPRRVILTGTPSPNGLEDLFGQIYVLDQGAALGRYVTHFRRRWFDEFGFERRLRPGAEKEITEAISPLIFSLTDKENLKLPPLVEQDVYVDLPEKAREVYNRLERELIVQLREGLILAKNTGVVTSKLRQIAGGSAYLADDLGRSTTKSAALHDRKIEAVIDIIDQTDSPSLVLYEFTHEGERLAKALKSYGVEHLQGGMTMRQSSAAFERWNKGELRALVAQVDVVARGLNLQAGRAVIFHTVPWNLEHYEQSIRRVWRQGQKGTVYLYHILARETVDQVVVRALRNEKGPTQERLMQALKVHLKV